MKQKYLLLTIILFVFLFLFSTPSLALIPGDFGSADNGPPDGVVDFEDLMIFALAYGSTPADANWNEVCDIASQGGVLQPDGVIDFEDLMIFAMHYGECECILPSAPILSDPGTTLPSPATYTVSWSSVSGATSYVLQEATSSDFTSGLQEYPLTDTSKSFSHTVTTSTTYYYRVAAINDCGQGGWSNVEDIEIEGVPSGDAKWTVMAYMDGDNDLEYVEWLILGRMESVGSTEEVNIVVQMDPYDDCTGTFRYYVTGVEAGSEYPLYPDDIVQTLPEQDMSDPTTLTDFINWAGDNYPADHYMLFLVDHGAGWREEDEVFKGIIWDDTTGGGEHIDIPELAQSLENANINIDILDLDACNMQMIEVAWELGMEMSTPPNYLIGSETIGWINGLPYDDILNQLTGNPSMEQLAICETIVSEYIDNLSTSGLPATISALHFNNEFLSNGLDIINNFANALLASTYQEEISSARSNAQAYVLWDRPQYKDLYDFAQIIKNNVPDCQSEAQAIMDLVNNVIVAEGHTGLGMDNSYGLSIYLIDSPTEYDSSYDLLRFATDTQWDEFLVSGEGVVTGVEVIATTRQLQTTGLEPEVVSLFEEESNTSKDYQIVNINNGLKSETVNWILVLWDAYYEVDGYKVYKSINSGEFNMVYDWQNPPTASGYGIPDPDFSEGNTYSYYVTAYGTDWETTPSEIVTITITSETFLPPCSLSNPTDGSIITDTNPVFSWSPVGLDTSDLPYGQVYSGDTLLIVYDANTFEPAWYVWFDDMTTSSATYDQNGNAYPLIPGHNYRWYIRTYGYDNNGNWVASSHSETWEFSTVAIDPVHNLTKDTYYNTIQAALDDAGDGNIIEVADGTYNESITFPTGKVVTLQSASGIRDNVIIQGVNIDTTVSIYGSSTGTTLRGFTIIHTGGDTGRGIYIAENGNLIVDNCIISGNTAYYWGGGICNYGGTLTVTGSIISGNTALTDHGGGIYNYDGTLTVTGSTISGNTTGWHGGGICNYNGTSTITGSTISGNSAYYYGGGINNYFGSTLTVTSSNISGNTAYLIGGGISNVYGGTLNISGTLNITLSIISDNTAYYDGGGIHNGGTLDITSSTISGNNVRQQGGGIYLEATRTSTIGGSDASDTSNFNVFTDNKKDGAVSADQHIRDSVGDCRGSYPYNTYNPN